LFSSLHRDALLGAETPDSYRRVRAISQQRALGSDLVQKTADAEKRVEAQPKSVRRPQE
jgi:hypothetical protein